MKSITFAFPLHNVMLSDAAGEKTDKGLKINCILNAVSGKKLSINGVPCIYFSSSYTAEVYLKDFKNELVARDEETGQTVKITVYYLKNAHMKYRFSLDDNIWFLQNIAKNQNVYKSIFDDPYLTMLKTLHDRHGTKFHVNIYYECPEHGGFNLTQMPDKYKEEWKANSDWLRLSPHANANKPDKPYISATYEQTKFEFGRIYDEIRRFAGEEACASNVTTVHWGCATDEAVRALRDIGVRAMVASYDNNNPSGVEIKMHLDAEKCSILNHYGMYYDEDFDVVMFKYSRARIQHSDLSVVPTNCEYFAKSMPLYTFFELCVHEQYFYEDYEIYMPDYYDRLESGIKWCKEHGYEPAFATEVLELEKL